MCEALVPPSPSRNFRQGLLIACTPVRLAPPHPPSIPPSPSGQGAASRPSGPGAAKSCSKPSAYIMIARLDYTRSCECTMHARRQAESLRSGVLLQRQLLCCRPGGATSTPRPTTTRSDPNRTVSNRGFGRKVCLQIMSAPCRDQPFTNRPYCAHGLLRTDDGHGTVRT